MIQTRSLNRYTHAHVLPVGEQQGFHGPAYTRRGWFSVFGRGGVLFIITKNSFSTKSHAFVRLCVCVCSFTVGSSNVVGRLCPGAVGVYPHSGAGGRASPFYIPQLPEITPHPFTLLFHAVSVLFFSVLKPAAWRQRVCLCVFLSFSLSLIEQLRNCLAKSDSSIPWCSSTHSLSNWIHLMFVLSP